ncbi:hypothetical protein PMAYCL1PPCAC_09353, partial [Pristionchus mayeri]
MPNSTAQSPGVKLFILENIAEDVYLHYPTSFLSRRYVIIMPSKGLNEALYTFTRSDEKYISFPCAAIDRMYCPGNCASISFPLNFTYNRSGDMYLLKNTVPKTVWCTSVSFGSCSFFVIFRSV